jgi:putative two-component system response regulator
MSTDQGRDLQTVVIVDDDTFGLALLRTLVEKVGPVHVETFDDPLEAQAWCRNHDLDVLITDYEMPGMNGRRSCGRCGHPRTRDVPMMMITALEDRDIRYQALECSANDYLPTSRSMPPECPRAQHARGGRGDSARCDGRTSWPARCAAPPRRSWSASARSSSRARFREPQTGVASPSRTSANHRPRPGAVRDRVRAAVPREPHARRGEDRIPDNVLLKPGRFNEEFA